MEENKNKNKNKASEAGLIIGAVVVLIVVLFALCLPAFVGDFAISGAFGDSFGVLTSLFSGLAFVGIIITILMQKEELQLQRTELSDTRAVIEHQAVTFKLQQFENTFFNSLDLLLQCRNRISLKGTDFIGSEAIESMYKKFCSHYLKERIRDRRGIRSQYKIECSSLEGVSLAYQNFYDERSNLLGPYYRTLYNLLKLIDKSDFLEDKKFYSGLVRAQLTESEYCLLFYNSISDLGRTKMLPLVSRYSFFKHMSFESLIPEHHSIYLNLLVEAKGNNSSPIDLDL